VKGQHSSVGIGIALGWLSLALLCPPGVRAADFTYSAVAFLDTKAPGGGTLVNDFEPGAVSPQGEVAFVVDYHPPDSDSEALYLASGGQLIPIVEPGKVATDDWSFVAGGDIGSFLSPVGMNGNGDVSFGCDIQKKGETDIKTGTFLWQRKSGQVIAVELPDQAAPGGGTFGALHTHTWPDVNDPGDVAFSVDVPDASGAVAQGVFVRMADGTYRVVARPGDNAPDGSHFTRAIRPSINNAGAVVFEAITDKDDTSGIYLSENGAIKAIASTGMDAPGGGTFADVQSPRLNNKGEIVFLADAGSGWGAYSVVDGKLTAVLAHGATLRDGATVDQVKNEDGHQDGTLALSDAGDVALHVDLSGNAGHAIYLLHGSQLVLVAQAGTDLGAVGIVDDAGGNQVAVNNQGQVAFQVKLTDGRTALVLATPVQ
jgi:hypothetical protein